MSIPTQERNTLSSVVPESRLFWGSIVAGVLMIALGYFLWVGPMAGMLAVWGITVILVAIGGTALVRIWSAIWT